MRLFIAINFSADTRSWLLNLRDDLRSRAVSGNFSAPENLHLTLAFLGECDAKQTAAAKAIVGAMSFEPFDVLIERIGCFRRHGGDIWWAGIREDKPLLELQRDLTERLIAAGFELERRKYSPHITLGREIVTDSKPWKVSPFGETVSMVELMESARINGKLTYTAIAENGR